MLLINHPLDCPICDQAGECELQDYTYQEGRGEGRYRDPKRFNPVEDFGGDVMYTPNRCILCTRCVRFMEDVAHDPVLNVSERGDRAVIGKFEGHDLTHPWAGNVIDLCPVGALLSKDSLNKARAWELDRTASVCPNCSQGCNMIVETRDNMVVRLRPRPNDDVNKYFMCDHGRLNYRWMNRQDRVDVPMVRQGAALAGTDWQIAIAEAAQGVVGEARVRARVARCCRTKRCTCLSELVKRNGRIRRVSRRAGRGSAAAGCRRSLAARRPRGERARRRSARLRAQRRRRSRRSAPATCSIVADEELAGLDASDVAKAGAIIVIGTTLPAWARHAASVVLPIANFAEEEGTFTNLRGRVQRFMQAKAAPGFARPSWYVLSDLLAAVGVRRRITRWRVRCLARSPRRASGIRRHELRHARPQGRGRSPARARERPHDPLALLQAAAQAIAHAHWPRAPAAAGQRHGVVHRDAS